MKKIFEIIMAMVDSNLTLCVQLYYEKLQNVTVFDNVVVVATAFKRRRHVTTVLRIVQKYIKLRLIKKLVVRLSGTCLFSVENRMMTI